MGVPTTAMRISIGTIIHGPMWKVLLLLLAVAASRVMATGS
jgi:hypothetical protein